MIKKLFLIFLPMLIISSALHAQKVWDFANDQATWPESAGFPAAEGPVIIDNLALYPHSSNDNFGQVELSSSSFDDGFTGDYRFKLNGGGGADPTAGEYIPSVRYLRFSVTGDTQIKVWARSGGSSTRTLYITDGTQVLAESTLSDTSTYFILTADYTGGAGDIYIFGSNNFSLYKIEVTANVGNTTLSLDSAKSFVSSKIRSVGKTIFVSNVITKTDIEIYSITGALVKSVSTTNDASFNLPSGLFVARLKTEEGQKAVKLLTY